jgi:hypothetical protein
MNCVNRNFGKSGNSVADFTNLSEHALFYFGIRGCSYVLVTATAFSEPDPGNASYWCVWIIVV